MHISADDLRRMERAHVKAWPALETADVQGWLWRSSGGGSQRANSVSTVEFTGADPAAALADVEARYRAKGARTLIQTFDLSEPQSIGDLLGARGYRPSGDTTHTMIKQIQPERPAKDVDVEETPDADWREVYLGAITESRRTVNVRILEQIPCPRAFFACRRGGAIISTGLCVVDHDVGVIECMATRLDARRQGGAQAVLRALESWAAVRGVRLLGLQVVTTNHPATALYRRCGFAPVATNRFWAIPDDR
jgi:GNAT superfamily N-acetyltransferase